VSTWVTDKDVVIGIFLFWAVYDVIEAVLLANERHAVTIGITGFDGGQLKGKQIFRFTFLLLICRFVRIVIRLLHNMIYKML
jgi:phosphoheptose isomerase